MKQLNSFTPINIGILVKPSVLRAYILMKELNLDYGNIDDLSKALSYGSILSTTSANKNLIKFDMVVKLVEEGFAYELTNSKNDCSIEAKEMLILNNCSKFDAWDKVDNYLKQCATITNPFSLDDVQVAEDIQIMMDTFIYKNVISPKLFFTSKIKVMSRPKINLSKIVIHTMDKPMYIGMKLNSRDEKLAYLMKVDYAFKSITSIKCFVNSDVCAEVINKALNLQDIRGV